MGHNYNRNSARAISAFHLWIESLNFRMLDVSVNLLRMPAVDPTPLWIGRRWLLCLRLPQPRIMGRMERDAVDSTH